VKDTVTDSVSAPMGETTDEAAGEATAHKADATPRRWLALPRGEDAARLTLVAAVVLLQNVLEISRTDLDARIGRTATGLLFFAALTASLALLLAALRTPLPRWRWPRWRWAQLLALVLVLAAVPIGVRQVGVAFSAGFRPPEYPNDGTTLDHYAAAQLLAGHNPYVTTDVVSAVRALGQDAEHTTPLGQGAFMDQYPLGYPDAQQLRRVFAGEPAGRPDAVPEFESHLSYPALSFLPLVPFVWAGLPSVVPFFALCFLALAALLIVTVPGQLRLWLGLLILADTPLLNSTVAGDLDVFYILLLFVAWRWWRRPILSAVFLGLAIAAKQLAWFFLPFYALLIWRERGWREAIARLAGAGGVFLLFNGPFILGDAHAWLAGVLAPQVDRMFPLGNGIVQLSLSGLLPLAPSWLYSVLELAAVLASIGWYWKYGRAQPQYGIVLAVLPLFFAWRSLSTYFYFVVLPAVALLLARGGHIVYSIRTEAGAGGTVPGGHSRRAALLSWRGSGARRRHER